MSFGLKIVLIFFSIMTFWYVIRKIRKSQAQIVDMCSWIVFSILIIVLAFFPDIAEYLSGLMGILSSVNFVFLAVIFSLFIEVFLLSIKVSKLESKLTDLSGEVAISEKDLQRKDNQT